MTRPRWVVLAILAMLPLAAAACSGGGDKGEKKATAEGQVESTTTTREPSVKVAKTSADLAKMLDIPAPDGYMLQPDQVGDTGPSDIEKASRDDGHDDAREFLTRTRFVRGYQRMWSRSETDDFVVYLYQFADHAGAAEYTSRLGADAMAPTPGVTIGTYTLPEISAALGANASDPTFANSSVTFVKGPYSVQIVVSGTTPTGLQSLATAVAEEQYSRL
jgi:hypothetical protein